MYNLATFNDLQSVGLMRSVAADKGMFHNRAVSFSYMPPEALQRIPPTPRLYLLLPLLSPLDLLLLAPKCVG